MNLKNGLSLKNWTHSLKNWTLAWTHEVPCANCELATSHSSLLGQDSPLWLQSVSSHIVEEMPHVPETLRALGACWALPGQAGQERLFVCLAW